MSSPHRLGLACALVGCLLVLMGCVPSVPEAAPEPNEITVVLESASFSLNPYASSLASRQVGRLVFQGLFGIDERGLPVPDLCTEIPTVANGGLSADRMTVRYRLGSARFHDGRPVSAEDVVYTVERLMSGDLVDEPGVSLDAVRSVRAVDARTVEVQLSRPNAGLVWRLAPYILPSHLLGESPDLLSDDFWLRPIGSGPYRVASSRPGASVLLESVDERRVALDVAFAPNERAARAVFDDAPIAVWIDAPVEAASRSESGDATTSAAWWRLGASGERQSLAADPAVRFAVRDIVASRWETPTAEQPAAPFGFRPEPASSVLATRQVERRLDAAGWLRDAEGMRMKGGRPLEVRLRTPALGLERAAAADRVKEAARVLGFVLEVQPSGADYYGSFDEGGTLARSEGDFFLTCLAVGAPVGYAWPYDAADIPASNNPYGLNWQRVRGATAAGWTDVIRGAASPDDAAEAQRNAWRDLERDDIVVWLRPTAERVIAKRVRGVKAHPFAEMALTGSAEWEPTR